jgi:hypothetical protein
MTATEVQEPVLRKIAIRNGSSSSICFIYGKKKLVIEPVVGEEYNNSKSYTRQFKRQNNDENGSSELGNHKKEKQTGGRGRTNEVDTTPPSREGGPRPSLSRFARRHTTTPAEQQRSIREVQSSLMISNYNPSFKDYCCYVCRQEGEREEEAEKIRHLLAETTIVGEIADGQIRKHRQLAKFQAAARDGGRR